MQQQFERDSAAVVMVEALYIAATQNKEAAVADYLSAQLAAGTLSLSCLRRHFQLLRDQQVPTVTVQQHQLDDYDQLLIPDTTTAKGSNSTCLTDAPATLKPLPNSQNPSQDPPVISYTRSVGIPRTPSPATPMVLRSVLAGTLAIGGRPTLVSPPRTGQKRRYSARRKNGFQLRL